MSYLLNKEIQPSLIFVFHFVLQIQLHIIKGSQQVYSITGLPQVYFVSLENYGATFKYE